MFVRARSKHEKDNDEIYPGQVEPPPNPALQPGKETQNVDVSIGEV